MNNSPIGRYFTKARIGIFPHIKRTVDNNYSLNCCSTRFIRVQIFFFAAKR